MTNEELLKVIEEANTSGATYLDLRKKGLASLPPKLFQLTTLLALDLSGNQLKALPPEISHLEKLQKLNLTGNQFAALPSELFELRNLTALGLGELQLSTLPSEIAWLKHLTSLYLHQNKLTTLPSELCHLTNLQHLILWGNKLTTLPPEICQLPELKELDLGGNPLISPPYEIAEKGIDAIRLYQAIQQGKNQPLSEVKLILIGEGAAGKTSLVKRLLGEVFDRHEDTTHGISIRGWEVEAGRQKIRVNLWDFGGQEIMHATHQFFLSKRSLYVLVLDGRRDERTEFWLQHIKAFGGNSPVLVVLNKQDANPSFDVNRPFLLEKYPNIRHFFRTSCRTGAGIAQFKEVLLAELARVEMIAIQWPKPWFAVKRRIEQMRQPYITCEAYRAICNEERIIHEKTCELLVEFLHDLGVTVHFKDYVLNAMHVLDPVWVTNAVYKIINAKELIDNQGVLHANSLGRILPQSNGEKHSYPAYTHVFIMELMRKFELCYNLDNETVLVPQLLYVIEPPFTFDYKGSLCFTLHYPDFLPPSVFPRFMVKVYKDIEDGLRWRTGVVLADKQHGRRAAIKADTEAKRINIWVQGDNPREYLHYLRYLLADINSGFEKLSVSERVPMPDDPARTVDYETLLKYAERGIERYIPEGSDKDYDVHELLGLVQPKDSDELARLADKTGIESAEKAPWVEWVNDLFELKPSLLGITFNLHGFFKELLAWQKQKRQQASKYP